MHFSVISYPNAIHMTKQKKLHNFITNFLTAKIFQYLHFKVIENMCQIYFFLHRYYI